MKEPKPAFAFPAGMPPEEARRLLEEAYDKVNGGRVVRRTTQRARQEDLDPPFDVAYVAEPSVEPFEDGLGVSLGTDILLYDEFPGWRRCLAIFEEEVGAALMGHLERRVRRWVKRHGRAKP